MREFDVAVIGNGVIGTLAAIRVKQHNPEKSVVLVGNIGRMDSASVAAGAMIAVYAEMEACAPAQQQTQEKYLKIGKDSSISWRKFLTETGGLDTITAEDTVVFLKKGHSEFEFANFQTVKAALRQDKISAIAVDVLELENKSNIYDAIRIPGEFAICSVTLFKHFETLLRLLNIDIIPDNADAIDLVKSEVVFKEPNLNFGFCKIVVAAGAQSAALFPQQVILPMLQGVGTAVKIDGNMDTKWLSKNVIRSVNRGGAQCGVHVVPQNNDVIYLGAGNYVSPPGTAPHRLDTIRYLLSTLENDLLSRKIMYNFTGNLVLGMRPKSIDGLPMIGNLASWPNVFVATGTNRLGLTWAPRIADQIVAWLSEKSKIDSEFMGWEPDRTPKTYGSEDEAINYFVSSRISNACEHGLSGTSAKELTKLDSEFRFVASGLITQLSKKFAKYDGIIFHPDNWTALLSMDIS